MLNAIMYQPFCLETLLNYIKDKRPSIIIFGADIAGKVTGQILKNEGISVDCYVDNNTNKCGIALDGIPVQHASELSKADSDTLFLIASTYISDIIHQIESMGLAQWAPIVGFLESAITSNAKEILQGDLRRNHAGGEFTRDFDEFVLKNMINSQRKYLDPDKLYIRSVDLIITERCSLKCKDCSNLMQFYERPQNIGDEELLHDLEQITSLADEINEIRIIGGDPFMNKNFVEITNAAVAKDNVNSAVVYTNGTICPPDERIAAIANPKTFVFVTTYGDHSRNVEKLEAALIRNNISFNLQPAYGWTDCGQIEQRNRDDRAQEKIFSMCCAKHFTTLTDGKIFRCPFTANAHRLSAIPDNSDDYFDLENLGDRYASTEQAKQALKTFLQRIPFTPACDYCNGRTYGDPEIQPGVQTEKPLTYKKYN